MVNFSGFSVSVKGDLNFLKTAGLFFPYVMGPLFSECSLRPAPSKDPMRHPVRHTIEKCTYCNFYFSEIQADKFQPKKIQLNLIYI